MQVSVEIVVPLPAHTLAPALIAKKAEHRMLAKARCAVRRR